jgi:hypothetical protein
MTIIANTFTRYSAVGIREDLSNTIFQISPEQTPFVSNMTKRRKITNTLFEWQTDSLANAAANHHIDGDDLGTTFTAVVPTVRLGTYSQILRKDFIIADNLAGALDLAGRRSSVAYNIAQNGAALRRDLEFNLCGVHTPAAGGSTSAARKTAPLTSWLTSNTSNGTNGVNPTLSGGIVNAGPVNGTQRAFTETLLKPVIQSVFENGGDPKFLMVNPFNKVKVSSFAGIAAQRYMAPDGPTTIIGAADVYVSDFGSLSVVPNRFSRNRDAYVIDPDMVQLATLRPMNTQELAKTGDASKWLLLMEAGLQVDNEAGLGVIRDLTTS